MKFIVPYTVNFNMEVVENVLAEAKLKEDKFRSIEVNKELELDIDEGNLLAVDQTPIDLKYFGSDKESYLRNLARDNTQLLINKIWQLPIEKVDDIIVAVLPDPKTILPREKKIPKPKTSTKWEQYAKLKGVHNTKKGKMLWDKELKEWRPRFGYKKANDPERQWVIEVPQNADPNEDQFAKLKSAKKERVAKNELQRLRNIARSQKHKVPGIGLTPTDTPSKDHISKALSLANSSTASMGKFTKKIANEKPPKNTGKKRKFEANTGSFAAEKERQLEILNKIQKKKPKIDVNKAMNKHIHNEDTQRSQARRENPKKSQKKQKGGDKKISGKKSGKKGKR